MDDADDKEREALLLRAGRSKPQFHYDEWKRWLTTRYRQPLDPHKIEDFWWRSDDKIADDAWLADLFAVPNWSLLSHYVNIGISLMMGATPVTYYLVETLRASPATVNTYAALTYLPWCLKFFYGLQTDLIPLLGVHRPCLREGNTKGTVVKRELLGRHERSVRSRRLGAGCRRCPSGKGDIGVHRKCAHRQ